MHCEFNIDLNLSMTCLGSLVFTVLFYINSSESLERIQLLSLMRYFAIKLWADLATNMLLSVMKMRHYERIIKTEFGPKR